MDQPPKKPIKNQRKKPTEQKPKKRVRKTYRIPLLTCPGCGATTRTPLCPKCNHKLKALKKVKQPHLATNSSTLTTQEALTATGASLDGFQGRAMLQSRSMSAVGRSNPAATYLGSVINPAASEGVKPPLLATDSLTQARLSYGLTNRFTIRSASPATTFSIIPVASPVVCALIVTSDTMLKVIDCPTYQITDNLMAVISNKIGYVGSFDKGDFTPSAELNKYRVTSVSAQYTWVGKAIDINGIAWTSRLTELSQIENYQPDQNAGVVYHDELSKGPIIVTGVHMEPTYPFVDIDTAETQIQSGSSEATVSNSLALTQTPGASYTPGGSVGEFEPCGRKLPADSSKVWLTNQMQQIYSRLYTTFNTYLINWLNSVDAKYGLIDATGKFSAIHNYSISLTLKKATFDPTVSAVAALLDGFVFTEPRRQETFTPGDFVNHLLGSWAKPDAGPYPPIVNKMANWPTNLENANITAGDLLWGIKIAYNFDFEPLNLDSLGRRFINNTHLKTSISSINSSIANNALMIDTHFALPYTQYSCDAPVFSVITRTNMELLPTDNSVLTNELISNNSLKSQKEQQVDSTKYRKIQEIIQNMPAGIQVGMAAEQFGMKGLLGDIANIAGPLISSIIPGATPIVDAIRGLKL